MHRRTDLAEIVNNPSSTTIKYLNIWFSGAGSYGIALSKLGWPVSYNNEPMLVWDKKNGLRVDMTVEDKTMYANTIFRYVYKDNLYTLQIDPKRISFTRVYNTIRAVWSQSKLLVNNQRTFNMAKTCVESISLQPAENLHDIEEVLENIVWPNVIIVDYIGEYILSILTNNLSSEKALEKLNSIQNRARAFDWYTQAMLSWSNYKEGKLSEDDLVNTYGLVAGDVYELTKPRYYELINKPMPRIKDYSINDMQINNLEDLAVGMHYLRSEVKRRSLVWIAALRKCLLENKVI